MTEVYTPTANLPDREAAAGCPDIHYTTLGRWPVSAYRQTAPGANTHPSFDEGLMFRMKFSRLRLKDLDAEQAVLFDEICAESVPGNLQEAKAAEADASTWQTWLAETASDEHVFDYLKWHVELIESQQRDPAIREEIADQKAQYKENLLRAMGEGWLQPGTVSSAIQEVDGVPTYIGDIFRTKLETVSAYYERNGGEIVVSGETKIPTSGRFDSAVCLIKQVGQHELNHAVLGRLPGRWLNEAVTEHIAQVLRYEKLEEIRPDERYNYGFPIYKPERLLFHYMLNEGAEVIPVELATLAYSEEPSGSREALDALKDAFNRAWGDMVPGGENVLDQLNLYIEGLERRYQSVGLSPVKAAEKAMKDVWQDIRYQPEVVFGGNHHNRSVILTS